MYRLLPLLVLLAACPGPEDANVEDTDTDTHDSDPVTPVDTDTDLPEETDTEVPADVVDVSIPDLRQGVSDAELGDVVRVQDVRVVTVSENPAMRGFTVQTPTTTLYAGLFVAVEAGELPAVGDTLDVIGRFAEVGFANAIPPLQTRATLEIASDVPESGWTHVGAGGPMEPVELTILQLLGQLEAYESTLVRVTGALEVLSGPSGDGDFVLAPPEGTFTPLSVGSLFVNPSASLSEFGPGGTFTSITGVAFFHGGYQLVPRSAADLVGYAAPVEDTDPDTDTDTDTDIETDTEDTFDTGGFEGGITVATTHNLHQGLYLQGQLLQFDDVIVTAVRYRTNPPADNGFVIQTPGAPTNAGLEVHVRNSTVLPAIGDKVRVVGEYTRVPDHTSTAPFVDSRARITVHSSIPDTTISVLSSGNPLPAPIPVTIDDLQDVAAMESYESMLVELDPAEPLEVSSLPGTQFRVKTSSSGADYALIIERFHDVRDDLPGLSQFDEFDAFRGVLWYEGTEFRIAPTAATDAVGHVDK